MYSWVAIIQLKTHFGSGNEQKWEKDIHVTRIKVDVGRNFSLKNYNFLSLFKGEIETHQIARYDTRLVTVETIKLSQNNKQKGKQISREKVNE
jgi:hypothetical protein